MHCKRVCVWRVNYDVPFSKYMPKFLMGKCVRHEFLISMADTDTNSMTINDLTQTNGKLL